MADNYTQLQADITDILASDDVNTALCVRLAEMDLNRKLRLQDMITKTALTVALTGDRYIASLPADFLEAFHVEQGGYRLNYYGPSNFWHKKDEIYTLMNDEIHVTGSSDVDLWYYGKETALSDSNQTNTFTNKCYDGLLQLSLAWAHYYQDQMERANALRVLAATIINDTNESDRDARMSGAPVVQR